jgi:hypothetical protein
MGSKKLPILLLGASMLAAGCGVQKNIVHQNNFQEGKEIIDLKKQELDSISKAKELERIQPILPVLENFKSIPDSVTYGKPDTSYLQTPQETKERGAGNCFDLTILFNEVLDSAGIENKIAVGEYIGKNVRGRHAWIETPYHIIESTGKGAIYDRDSIRNLENGPKYIYSNIDQKGRITNHIREYYDRTGIILDIKGFEPFGKALPLSTSPEFSSYFSDSTFLKTLPKKK